MSKRILSGLGKGLHELGSSMGARNAAARAAAIDERKAEVAYQRRVALEKLANQYGVERIGLQHKNALAQSEQRHGYDMEGRKFTAQRSDARAERSATRADTRSARSDANALARFEAQQRARAPDTKVGDDGIEHRWNPDTGMREPVMVPGKTGILSSDAIQPGSSKPMAPSGAPPGFGATQAMAPPSTRIGTTPPTPFKPQPRPSTAGRSGSDAQLVDGLVKTGMSEAEAWQKVYELKRQAKANPAQMMKTAVELAALELGLGDITSAGPEEAKAIARRAREIAQAMSNSQASGGPSSSASGPILRYVPGKGVQPVSP